jgi:hypothetical protein
VSLDLDLLAGGDTIGDAFRKIGRKRMLCALDRRGVGIERDYARGVAGDPGRKPAIAAAELEYSAAVKVAQAAEGGEVGLFRV